MVILVGIGMILAFVDGHAMGTRVPSGEHCFSVTQSSDNARAGIFEGRICTKSDGPIRNFRVEAPHVRMQTLVRAVNCSSDGETAGGCLYEPVGWVNRTGVSHMFTTTCLSSLTVETMHTYQIGRLYFYAIEIESRTCPSTR